MQITVDTKHDSHDDIRKVIAMLRHLVGEKNVLTNAPMEESPSEQTQDLFSAFSNSSSLDSPQSSEANSSQAPELISPSGKKSEELFSDLFSEEDLPEAKAQPEEEEEDETPAQKKPKIEFY
jgi:hypothetical protein